MTDADTQYTALMLQLQNPDLPEPDRAALVEQLHARYLQLRDADVNPLGGTTPAGYPYPTPTDPLAAGADAIRALAESIATQPRVPLSGYSAVWQPFTAAPLSAYRSGSSTILDGAFQNISAGTFTPGLAAVAMLPVGYRPDQETWLPAYQAIGSGSVALGYLQLLPSGQVTVQLTVNGSYSAGGLVVRTSAPYKALYA